MVEKEDMEVLIIPCTIGAYQFNKVLKDLAASLILLSLAIFKKIYLGTPKGTTIRILIVNWSTKRSVGVLYDVIIQVDQLIFLINFFILDFDIDYKIHIIIGRPFLGTRRLFIDVECGELKFWSIVMSYL